jgi:hypothetical protein
MSRHHRQSPRRRQRIGTPSIAMRSATRATAHRRVASAHRRVASHVAPTTAAAEVGGDGYRLHPGSQHKAVEAMYSTTETQGQCRAIPAGADWHPLTDHQAKYAGALNRCNTHAHAPDAASYLAGGRGRGAASSVNPDDPGRHRALTYMPTAARTLANGSFHLRSAHKAGHTAGGAYATHSTLAVPHVAR